MKKIVLLSINSRYTHSNLALYYLREELQTLGLSAQMIELSLQTPYTQLLHAIVGQNPAVLCASVYIWNSQMMRSVLADCKRLLPTVTIVVGGPEVSYHPEEWLQHNSGIDYVICGAGEEGLRQFAQADFCWTEPIIRVPNRPFTEIPMPYRSTDKDNLAHRYIYYESSRGCLFRCSYCLSSRQDICLEEKPVEMVFQEIKQLLTWQPNIIKFVDRSFNANPDRARAIWRFLSEQETNTLFHFEVHPELLNEVDLALLATIPTGRFQFEIGVQSLNPATLQHIHRHMNWDRIGTLVSTLRRNGNIHLHLDLIAGLPEDSLQTFKNSLRAVWGVRPHNLQLGFLKVLPGTDMELEKQRWNLQVMADPPYQVIQTETMSWQDFALLEAIEHVMDLTYNNGLLFHFWRTVIDSCLDVVLVVEQLAKQMSAESAVLPNLSRVDCFSFAYGWSKDIDDLTTRTIIQDALRLDWAMQVHGHSYPTVLEADNCDRTKDQWHEICNKEEDIPPEIKALKRHWRFYYAESEQIRDTILHGCAIALICNGLILPLQKPYQLIPNASL